MRFCASPKCRERKQLNEKIATATANANANVQAPSASGDQRKSEWKSQQISQFYPNNYFAQRIQLFWQSHIFQLLDDTIASLLAIRMFLFLSRILLINTYF